MLQLFIRFHNRRTYKAADKAIKQVSCDHGETVPETKQNNSTLPLESDLEDTIELVDVEFKSGPTLPEMAEPPDPIISSIMTRAGIPRTCRHIQNPESPPSSSTSQSNEVYVFFKSKGTKSEENRRNVEKRAQELEGKRKKLKDHL